MRPSALFAAAAAYLAPVTEAYIHTLGFPSTIQAGVPFDVYYEQLISQPRVHNLIFGITKDNGFVSKGEIGSDLFLSAYIKGTFGSVFAFLILPVTLPRSESYQSFPDRRPSWRCLQWDPEPQVHHPCRVREGTGYCQGPDHGILWAI